MEDIPSSSIIQRGKGSGRVKEVRNGGGEASARIRGSNFGLSETMHFLNAIHEVLVSTNSIGTNAITGKQWEKITILHNKKAGKNRTKESLLEKWRNLRKHHRKLHQLRCKPGWGWDDAKQAPEAPDATWDALILSNKEWEYYRGKEFLWYPLMQELVGNIVATGALAANRVASGQGSSDASMEGGQVTEEEFQDRLEIQSDPDNMQFSEEPILIPGKRKSGESSAAPSRTKKIKRRISEMARGDNTALAEDIHVLALTSREMLENQREMMALYRHQARCLPTETYQRLKKYNLPMNIVLQMGNVLGDPVKRDIFGNLKEKSDVWEFIKFHIPGFVPPPEPETQTVPPNYDPQTQIVAARYVPGFGLAALVPPIQSVPQGFGQHSPAPYPQGQVYYPPNQKVDNDRLMEMLMRNQTQLVMNFNAIANNVSMLQEAAHSQVKNEKESSTGRKYVQGILEGHSDRSYDLFHVNPTDFMALCDEIISEGELQTDEVTVEEQIGMFLQIIGPASTMRQVAKSFQRSTDTVQRVFNNVLHQVGQLQDKYIKLPDENAPIHPSVVNSPFKDALGAIDGTHIPAHVAKQHADDDVERFCNKKDFMSQNVLAAVDFDGKFVYVLAGWEGSAHDSTVLQSALERGTFNVPANKYYLADLEYGNNANFICPYHNQIYHSSHLDDRARDDEYACPEEKFNHRHAQLRKVVERAIGILKSRFGILTGMATRPFKFETQRNIVIACCILHNFLKERNARDEMRFADDVGELEEPSTEGSVGPPIDIHDSEVGGRIRDNIRDAL